MRLDCTFQQCVCGKDCLCLPGVDLLSTLRFVKMKPGTNCKISVYHCDRLCSSYEFLKKSHNLWSTLETNTIEKTTANNLV